MYPGDPNAHLANVYHCRCTIAAKVMGFKSIQKGLSVGGSSSNVGAAEQIGSVDFFDEKRILSLLNNAERETVDLPYEVNYTITSDGKVWRVKGDKASVNPNSIPSSLIGSYSYHNHPKNETWYSFSAEDVGVFFEHRQKYSKCSDDLYEFFMHRTNDTIDMDYDAAYNKFKSIHKNEVYNMAFYEGLDLDEDGFHEVMKILSKEYHFEYHRRRR